MKVCARDTGGVLSSGSGERVTPIVVSNNSRDVMVTSSTITDADADAKDEVTSLSRIKTVRKWFVTTVI